MASFTSVHELMAWVDENIPGADGIATDNSGQLVIYTNLAVDKDDGETLVPYEGQKGFTMTTTAVLTDAQRSVTKGKLKARTWMPYLSHIFSIMRLHVTEDVEIAGVDRFGKLAINEKNFSSLNLSN